MDQVGGDQQLAVAQDLRRRAVGVDAAILAEDDHAIGDDRDDVQLMGRRDDRASRLAEPPDQVHEHPLRARIECRGRLVEEDDVRTQRQHRCDRGPLLLAAGELEGCPVRQVPDLHEAQRLVAARRHLGLGKPQLERPECHVVHHGCAEELDVGVLEHEADLPVEPEGVEPVDDGRDVQAERPQPPAGRRDDPVEELEQGRLSRPVRTEEHDLLPRPDHEVDSIERDLAVVVQVAHAGQFEDRLGRHRREPALDHGSVRPTRTAATPSATAPPRVAQSAARIR